MIDLSVMLFETGLLQFGRFEAGKPYQCYLDMLPSYPDVLDTLVKAISPLIGEVDHLLSTVEAIPLGIGLSLFTHIPLVYSRGTDKSPVYNLVGAYDIGHPAVLLANQPTAALDQLINDAKIVGLNVNSILVIIDDGTWHSDRVPMQSIVHLTTAVDLLVATQSIPEGQARGVKAWINHRPGSGVP